MCSEYEEEFDIYLNLHFKSTFLYCFWGDVDLFLHFLYFLEHLQRANQIISACIRQSGEEADI